MSVMNDMLDSEYEQGKKDGWEACETCHGVVDGKHMEAESLRQQLSAFNDNCEAAYRLHEEKCDQLRQQVTLLSYFVIKISEQLPEKPDHYTPCYQCGQNSSEAEDIIEALAVTKEQ